MYIEFLKRRYCEEGKTAKQIGDELRVSKTTILRDMRKFGIERRKAKGWTTDVGGYILVKAPDHPRANTIGYVREHRLVMEKKLGRYLEPYEVVHHKDHNRKNNDPDNLELKASNSEHRKEHNDPEQMRRMQAKSRENMNARKQALIANPPPCACGCGRPVKWTMKYSPRRFAKLLHGHGRVVKKREGFAQWLEENRDTKCACGCDQSIQLTYNHYKHRKKFPKFIHGHNVKILNEIRNLSL
jgi:hypothetical protein